jgi:drug/metabolite transporter (DMT)-like permease
VGLFGYIFWDEIPTIQVVIGAAIIIASAIYIAQREAKKRTG